MDDSWKNQPRRRKPKSLSGVQRATGKLVVVLVVAALRADLLWLPILSEEVKVQEQPH